MITGLSILDQALWGNSVAAYLLFIIYVILGLVIIKLISIGFNYVFKRLEETIKKYEIIFGILRHPEPILFIIFIAILRNAVRVFHTSTVVSVGIEKLSFALYVLFAAWFIVKILIIIIEKYLGKYADESEDIRRFDYLKPLIKTLIRIFIFIIAALLIVSNLGFNISGLIAGLGIGGIAIAFASRELLENFFSGLIIYTERPIKVGDTVKANDGAIYGDVQEIGVRTSKIKSFDGTIHTVPNSILSGRTLENVSSMPARRVVSVLSLSSKSTPEQIEKTKKIIASIFETKKKKKELIEEHHIFFDKFTTSSMDITYIYWINKEIDYWEQMDVKDSINTEIKKELDKAKIELANFPK